jgi:hypothetical protein
VYVGATAETRRGQLRRYVAQAHTAATCTQHTYTMLFVSGALHHRTHVGAGCGARLYSLQDAQHATSAGTPLFARPHLIATVVHDWSYLCNW